MALFVWYSYVMKKLTRKTKVVIVLIVVILVISLLVIVRINHSSKCQDIIGDGYAMGTDSEPVVIGNACDL
jgi:competence protein ComGC